MKSDKWLDWWSVTCSNYEHYWCGMCWITWPYYSALLLLQ